MIGLCRDGKTNPKTKKMIGMPTIADTQITMYSDGLSFRSAAPSSRSRFAPKSRFSTALFRLASAADEATSSAKPSAFWPGRAARPVAA